MCKPFATVHYELHSVLLTITSVKIWKLTTTCKYTENKSHLARKCSRYLSAVIICLKKQCKALGKLWDSKDGYVPPKNICTIFEGKSRLLCLHSPHKRLVGRSRPSYKTKILLAFNNLHDLIKLQRFYQFKTIYWKKTELANVNRKCW